MRLRWLGKWIDYGKSHPKGKKFLPNKGVVWVIWSFGGWSQAEHVLQISQMHRL